MRRREGSGEAIGHLVWGLRGRGRGFPREVAADLTDQRSVDLEGQAIVFADHRLATARVAQADLEARADVLREGQVRRGGQRYAVGIIENDQASETQRARQRRCL